LLWPKSIRIAPKGVAAGTRYPEILMHVLDG
jgi:hypothetical protein